MYNIIDFIISFGALQGIIIGIVFLVKGIRSKQEEIYLSFILLGLAAILVRVLVISFYGEKSSLIIYLNFVFLISPSLYLYAKASLRKDENMQIKYLQFMPFIVINTVYILFYFIFNKRADYQSYQQYIFGISEGISLIYFGFYLYRTNKICKQNKASYTEVQYQLLKILNLVFLVYFIIWMIYVVVEWLYFKYTIYLRYYYPLMMVLATTLYYLSLRFLIHARLFSNVNGAFKRKTIVIEENESKELLRKLKLIMDKEKPYLNDDISLASLAASIDVNSKTLSYVINEHTKKNYNDYINSWRIEEVKSRLKDPNYDNYKMLSIAFDCGFKSKSTFNLAFKKATGLSPSEYKNSLKS